MVSRFPNMMPLETKDKLSNGIHKAVGSANSRQGNSKTDARLVFTVCALTT
jgi:hypothetical protein